MFDALVLSPQIMIVDVLTPELLSPHVLSPQILNAALLSPSKAFHIAWSGEVFAFDRTFAQFRTQLDAFRHWCP